MLQCRENKGCGRVRVPVRIVGIRESEFRVQSSGFRLSCYRSEQKLLVDLKRSDDQIAFAIPALQVDR
jgi:hypothetical protein